MKRSLFFLVGIIISIAFANAGKVTEQQALEKAQSFMRGKQFVVNKGATRTEQSEGSDKPYYIFNVENKGGFIIVSGDDRTEPILGYSDHGSLNVDSVPNNVKWLLDYYEKALTAIVKDKTYSRPARTRGEERALVKALMATEWGQDFPYNLNTPIVDGKRTVTGCVATALAQVLNYNRWPKDYTSSVPAYTTYSKQIYMLQLEPIKFGWGSVSLQFLSNLMLYCGQAVQMNYGVDESSADVSQIPDVLKTIFGYNNDSKYLARDDYSDEDWDDLMYAEMAGGRPVIYSGFGEQSTGYSGHAFVIDGYDSGRYHVNWGWDGQSNGFFMLTGLDVTGGNFNEHQGAVVGVQSPEGPARAIIPKVQVNTISHNNSSRYFWRQNDGNFSPIDVTAYVYGTDSEKETLQLGWGLFNEERLVAVYDQVQQEISPDYSEGYWQESSIVINSDVADGDYSLLPVYRSNESEEWVADVANIYGNGLSSDYYTEIRITNNLMKLIYGTSKVFDRENYGYIVKDDIAFDLWKDLDEKDYATVIPPQSGNYSGDIVIPDMVSYNSNDYRVYDADVSTFVNCQELTSLSISMSQGPRIANCPKLVNIEFREGIAVYLDNMIFSCESLKKIMFNSNAQLLFHGSPFGGDLPVLNDVYFMSLYPPCLPPLFGEYIFPVKENVTLHIPKGAMSDYQKSGWKNWNLSDDLIVENKAVKWGYVNDNNAGHYNSPEIGSFNRCDVDVAIHVPAEMIDKYKGQKITGIEFFCIDMLNSNFPDYVFITKPGTDYLVKQSADISRTTGWKSVILPEPYTITGEELFVGIGRNYYHDFTISTNEPKEYDGQWCRIMDENKKWENRFSEPVGYPLTLRFIIEGENLPKDVRLCQPRLINDNSSNKIQAIVVNRCSDLLTSYTVKWDFDGKVNGTRTIEASLASSLTETLEIDIPSDLDGYYHTLTLDVLGVNGEEDAIPANSHLVYEFTKAANHYPRTMVLENFVGTWCGWSPRGYSVVEKMYEKYPDNFISIGIHENTTYGTNDAVGEPYNYKAFIETYTSTPTFLVNRVKTIDTTFDEAVAAYEEQQDNADAMIQANAVYASEDSTTVTVKTATTFGFTDDGNADFCIAYVVVEDNVGPYNQANFYSDPSMPDNPNDYMNEWYKKGNPVEMKFNDVARGIYDGLNGKDGSVPTSVVAGKAYEYEYTLKLPDNIQNKKNIRIVTLLIDNKSGVIVNAAESHVRTSLPITISSAKQLPYCSDKDLDFSSKPELKAYVATGYDKTTGTIWLTRVKDVPANTGFLIMGDAGDYEIPVKDGGSNSYYSNMFKGTLEKITLQTTETIGGKEYTNYYLSNGEQGVGFYKVTKAEGQSLGANRAYLPIPTEIPAVGTAGGTEAIKVSAAGQVPYYSANSLDFTDMPDVKAYTATGYDYKSGTIWLTRVKKVPAETGILIMADAGNYDVPKTSVASIYENMFKGTLEAMTLYTTLTTEDGKEYTNYYLSNGEQGVGFYKVTKAEGVSLGANRCYLPIPKQSAGTRSVDDDPTNIRVQESDEVIGLRIFASGTTGIETNNREPLTNNHWYNLQGQRVENPTKGIYIRNGKKVIIK